MYRQSILFFSALFLSQLALGAVDVLGDYSGSSTQTWSGCSDPADDGTYSGSLSLNIDDQSGATYQGVGQTDDGTIYSIFGTVDDEGVTSGSITYVDADGTSGDGSFTGNFSDDSLSLSYTTTDLEGDTCTTVGTAILARASSSSEIDQALQQFASAGTITLISSFIQHQNLALRQTKLRKRTVNKIDVSELNFNIGGKVVSVDKLATLLLGEKFNGADADNTALSSKPGFFATGTISIGDRDNTNIVTGYDFTTGGLTVGSDYAITENLFLGGALGYSSMDSDFDNSAGELDVDGYSVAIYSTYSMPGGFYIDGIMRFGWSDYAQHREFNSNDTLQKASADYESSERSLSISTGYDYASGAWNLEPFARIDYVEVDIDGFNEKAETLGADSSLLTIEDQNISSLQSALGGQFSYALSTRQGVFLPTFRFEWQHEFKDDSRSINSRLISDPTIQASLETDNPDRDFFNVGAGVTGVFPNGILGFLYYEYLLGHSEISQYTINGGIRIEF